MKDPACALAVFMGAVLLSTPAVADVISVSCVSVATGVDDGPQDGAFDSISAAGLGCVNNNGYTSFRTAFEFSLSALTAGATINTATLTVSLSNFEGQRVVEVHGYAGDGTVQLADFAVDGLVGSASVDPSGTQIVNFDATRFVADLVVRGETLAGFNVRTSVGPTGQPGVSRKASGAGSKCPGLRVS